VLFDFEVDQFPPMRLQPPKRSFLIGTHEPAITGHIGGENGGSLRSTDGLNDARELDQDAIAGGLDDTAFVLGNARIDQFAAVASKPSKSHSLVLAHQAAVADNIGGENRREPAIDPLSAQISLPEAPQQA